MVMSVFLIVMMIDDDHSITYNTTKASINILDALVVLDAILLHIYVLFQLGNFLIVFSALSVYKISLQLMRNKDDRKRRRC